MYLDQQSSILIHHPACMLLRTTWLQSTVEQFMSLTLLELTHCLPLLDLPSRNECFVHVISNEMSGKSTFQGNTARKSGSILYGGMLNKCNYSHSEEYTLHLFNTSIKDETTTHEVAAISSDPKLCFCTEGGSHKCKEEEHVRAFPGQKVNVSVIANRYTYSNCNPRRPDF